MGGLGESVQKSHCMWWSRRLVAPCFWERMKCWNFNGSRMKNTGVLLPTMSKLLSEVYIFSANPRGSRWYLDCRAARHGGEPMSVSVLVPG